MAKPDPRLLAQEALERAGLKATVTPSHGGRVWKASATSGGIHHTATAVDVRSAARYLAEFFGKRLDWGSNDA